MTVLFFDTETTGFVKDRLPINHPDQPHIVQLAAQLCADDGDILAGFSLIVNNRVAIPEQASAVHGITQDIASDYGASPATAIGMFRLLLDRADIVVAHNTKFDKAVVEIAINRLGVDMTFEGKSMFCTMEASSPIINLPPTERMIAVGITTPKPPKLEEVIRFFFDEPLDGAHDAMVDVIACRRVYFHLKTLGAVDA